MAGFEAIYKQTVTLFNRVQNMHGEDIIWYPTVLENVHLVVDKSHSWNMQGGMESDNIRLHVRYKLSDGAVWIGDKRWYEPKAYRALDNPFEAITFAYGDAELFDFFVEGRIDEFTGPIPDSSYERKGFYNYMNAKYDNVFAITSVSKYNLIPHFEIMGR